MFDVTTKYRKYLLVLADELEEYYHMSHEKAVKTVEDSYVIDILSDERYASLQMHEPVEDTVARIYRKNSGSVFV